MNNNLLSIITPENAGALCKHVANSKFFPAALRGDAGSAFCIMDMAARLGVSMLTIANNVYEVHGNMGFSGKFAIAMLMRCPKYTRVKYDYINGTDYRAGVRVIGYRADAPDDPDIGPAVTPEMVRAEGWNKNPKWTTMPDLMYRYRAAAFFLRLYAPDMLMGMQTAEELDDINTQNQQTQASAPQLLRAKGRDISAETTPALAEHIEQEHQLTLGDIAAEAATISATISPETRSEH